VEPECADQRLPPGFCDFANVAETEPAPAGCFGAAAFFGLRTSLLECCWPLAMGDLFGLGRASPCDEARLTAFYTSAAMAARSDHQ
jgi:hypothetical protein